MDPEKLVNKMLKYRRGNRDFLRDDPAEYRVFRSGSDELFEFVLDDDRREWFEHSVDVVAQQLESGVVEFYAVVVMARRTSLMDMVDRRLRAMGVDPDELDAAVQS